MEILEDRVVPDGTSSGALYDPTGSATTVSPPADSITVDWQGQTRLAAPGRWIVQVDGLAGTPGEQMAAFEPIVESFGLDLHVDTQLGIDGLFRLAGPSDLTIQALSDSLGGVAGVQFVEPDFVEAAAQVIPNDPLFPQLWGMNNTGVGGGVPDADIDGPEAWDLTAPSRGSTQIITAIDDSGVDYTHPDLYLNIWLNQTEIPANIRPTLVDTDADGLITFWDLNAPANAGKVADNNFNQRIDAGDILRPTFQGGWMDGIDGNGPNTNNGFVDDLDGWDFFSNDNNPDDEWSGVWHGTHVAGTIGAIGNNGVGVAGVNWKTQIMIVRGLGPSGSGPYSALLGALNYAVDNGAKLSNHSWGGSSPSSALEASVINAHAHGHLMVVAAGNGGFDGFGDNLDNPAAETSFPAVYPYDNIITVANTTITDSRNTSSNYGLTSVDLGAPGTNVLSTMHSRFGPSYGTLTGTSMATPHVTGTAALMWSINPSASYTQIRNGIFSTVDPISALATNGPTPVATGGRLNAARALQAVGFAVAATGPEAGSIVTVAPTDFAVQFTAPYDPASVQPSDLTVNGIAATSVDLIGPNSLTFHFATTPVTTEGVQTMTIAAGAVSSLSNGFPVSAFTSTFRFDATPLVVVSASPTPGAVVPAPFTFIDVTFNEAVDPASVQASDLSLSRGTVVSAEVLAGTNGRTVRFSLAGLTTPGTVVATLGAGSIADASGNPGLATPVVLPYAVNTTGSVFPVPLTPLAPLGSLVYTGSTTGAMGFQGEVDPFTLSVDAGQTITVVVTPASGGGFTDEGGGAASTLQPRIVLRDPSGAVVATAASPAAGMPAVLQVGPAATLGTYRIEVSALAGVDAYSLVVYLNAAAEAEAFGGPSNSTRADAQDLGPAFLPLQTGSPADRAAVRGQLVNTPSGVNLITNGNFETGSLSGWTASPSNSWIINNGSFIPPGMTGSTLPISGSFDAVISSAGGARSLSTSFVVPAVVGQATLSWSDRIRNLAQQFADPNQEFRVLITDAVGNVLQTVFSTNPGDPLIQSGPNNRSFDITSLLQSRAGQTLRLRFEEQDTLFFFGVTLDNIALTVSSSSGPPEASDDFYALNLTAGQPVNLALGQTSAPAAPSFSSTRTDFPVPVGRYPIFVGYRDLNGDGKLDMVSAINDTNTDANGAVGVRLGNGDGTFGALTQYPTNGGVFTRFLDFGDINGDGKLDVVATSDSSGTVSLFRGNGDGTFQPVLNTQVPVSALGLTVGDLNGDGRPDVVVPHFSGIISVLLAQPNGTLSGPSIFSVGAGGSFGSAVGDLNGDGKLDVVTANFNSANMSVLLGNGNGTFGPPSVLSMANNPYDIELADLNGDGKLDAITGNQGANNIAVRLGNGNGTFGNPVFFLTGGGGPRTISVGDVNNDGKLDVVTPNFGSGGVSVLPGNGNGTFGNPIVFATGINPNQASIADVNGDGLLDISTADPPSGFTTLRLNTTPTIRLELQEAAGNVVASAVRGAANFDQGLSFTPSASGVYYARVFGTVPSAAYTLAAIRDAVFDTEPNDTFAAAQPVTGTGGALGYLAASASRLFAITQPQGPTSQIIELNPATGAEIRRFNAPELVFNGQPVGLAFDGTTLFLINGFGTRRLYEINPDTGAVLDSPFFSPFSQPDGLAVLNGRVYVSDAASNQIAEYNPATNTVVRTFAVAGGTDIAGGLAGITGPDRLVATAVNTTTGQMRVIEIDPANGQVTASFNTTIPVGAALGVAVANGQIYVSRVDGTPRTEVYTRAGTSIATLTNPTQFLALGGDDTALQGEDWYSVNLAAGQRVQFTTTTPAGGPGEFVNKLNPHIELFSPAGNSIATGAPLLDGRNETIVFTVPAAGTYRIRLTGENKTTGEYFLGVNFAPVARNDNAATNEDLSIPIPVLANDTDDANLDQAPITIVTPPVHGTLQVFPGGGVLYTPDTNFSGPDSFTYTVTDSGGIVSNVATVSILVFAVADTPTLTVTPTASGNESAAIPLDIAAALTDTDGSEVLSMSLAGVPTGGVLSAGTQNVDGSWTLTPAQLAGLSFTLPDNLPGDVPFTLVVTATSRELSNGFTASRSATIDVTVANVAPAATFNTPAGGLEGSLVTVSLTDAADVSLVDQAAGFTYAFDLGSGYGAYTSANTADFTPADNGAYTIRAKVRDKDGGETEYTATVVIDNVAPQNLAISGPTDGVRGQTLSYTGSFTDPGSADTHSLDWTVNRGGTIYATGSGPAFSFIPTDAGTYTVTFTVRDDDGGTGSATTTVSVGIAAVQPDLVDPGSSVLVVGGTTGSDTITISPSGSSGRLVVSINGSVVGTFSGLSGLPLDGMIVFSQAGDDDITVAGSIDLTAWLYGGAGDDRLKGGAGNDVLLGGDGDDQLTGGQGRDFLIGGIGADRIVGNADDDLEISGFTAYDADRSALAVLLGTWTDPALSYQQRVATIQGGILPNGVHLGSDTVGDDDAADLLTGASGLDWFWFDPDLDRITDLHDGEMQNDLIG